jgi:hypothetical protein
MEPLDEHAMQAWDRAIRELTNQIKAKEADVRHLRAALQVEVAARRRDTMSLFHF